MSIVSRLSLILLLWPLEPLVADVSASPQLADVVPGAAVAVRFEDGHVATGIVDEQTDSQRLWLRVEQPWMMFVSGYRWDRVCDITIQTPPGFEQSLPTPLIAPLPEPELLPIPEEPLSLMPQRRGAFEIPWHESDWSEERSRSIASLHIEATPANWDRDAAMDGLRVRVVPLDAEGDPVCVRGTVDFELVGQRHRTNGRIRQRDMEAFPTLGRWTVKLEPSEFDTWGTIMKLPFRNYHPQVDLDIAEQGLLSARLRVPSVGTFEASDDWVTLKPVNRLRDDHQLWSGQRFIPPESRPTY